jgi:multiple sugar transport system substrate-binding protein
MPDEIDDRDESESARGGPTRRDVLKGITGVAGLASLPSFFGACSGVTGATAAPSAVPSAPATASTTASPSSVASPSATTGTLTVLAAAPIADLLDAFTRSTGIATRIATETNGDIGDQIEAILSGTPEDVVMFIGGYKMRTMAAQGLLEPIDDVWAGIGNGFSPAVKEAVSGDDGHVYALPWAQSPWGVFYSKSLFAERGYSVPRTWTELLSLARAIQKDGIIPFAMGDRELWPALGTFDILNLRQNGYRFHLDLLAGTEVWTDPRVRDVFLHWRELIPLCQPGPAGRSWVDAGTTLAGKGAAMMYLSTFLTGFIDPSVVDDLDMFAFPALGTAFDAEHAVEDPVDAFVVPRNSPGRAADFDSAKAFIEFMAQPSNQAAVTAAAGGPGNLPGISASSGLTPLQTHASEIVAAAKHSTQYLDRDAPPSFVGPLEPLIRDFLDHPDQDLSALQGKIQAAWDQR